MGSKLKARRTKLLYTRPSPLVAIGIMRSVRTHSRQGGHHMHVDTTHLSLVACMPTTAQLLHIYIYIYVRQPAARGHRAFTDLSAARVRGRSIMHSLQPCQLGNDSLLNMIPIPPLGIGCMALLQTRRCI